MFSKNQPIQFRGRKLTYRELSEPDQTETYVVHSFYINDSKDDMAYVIELQPNASDAAILEHHLQKFKSHRAKSNNLILINFQCDEGSIVYLPRFFTCYVATQKNKVKVHGNFLSFQDSEITPWVEKKRKTQTMVDVEDSQRKKADLKKPSTSETPALSGSSASLTPLTTQPLSKRKEIEFSFSKEKREIETFETISHKENQSDQSQASIKELNKKLEKLSRSRCDVQAQELYAEIGKSADIWTKNIMLDLYIRQGDFKAAEALYKEIGSSAMQETKIIMLRCYMKKGDFNLAERLYREMGSRVSLESKNILLNGYVEHGKFKIAEALYKKLPSPIDVTTKNILLKSYIQQNDFIAAEKFYMNMGSGVNNASRMIMLDVYAKQGRYEDAMRLYTEIGNKSDLETKKTMLNLFIKHDNYEPAKKLFSDIGYLVDLKTKNAMLKLYRQHGDSRLATRLYDSIGAEADIETKNIMQAKYVRQHKDKDGKQVHAKGSTEADIATKNATQDKYVQQDKDIDATEVHAKGDAEADIATKNAMLNFYMQQGDLVSAHLLYDEIGSDADSVTKNIMLKHYVQQGDLLSAEKFYAEIGSDADKETKQSLLKLYGSTVEKETKFSILDFYAQQNSNLSIQRLKTAEKLYAEIANTADLEDKHALLKVYAYQGCFISAEKFEFAKKIYAEIGVKATKVTKCTMLKLCMKVGKYQEATELYEDIGVDADIICKNIMLKILCKQDKVEEALDFYQSIPVSMRTLDSYASILHMYVRLITPERFNIMQAIADEYQHKLDTERDYNNKLDHYGILANCYHIFIEKITSHKDQTQVQIYQDKIVTILNYLQVFVPIEQMSMQLAYLFSIYCKDKEFAPEHTPLTPEGVEEIKRKATQQLDHPLMPLKESKNIRIVRVNLKGETVSEYYLNDSIYNAIAPGIPNYIIITFHGPQKANRIPLFFPYNGKMYRTDVFGGTKLNANITENKFGSLIAVPIEASEFFKTWFTSDESFWYGQRAFLPENEDCGSKGLQGRFCMALIPDALNYTMMESFIVQDGCGYIKQSAADKMGMTAPDALQSLQPAHLTYQAIQSYESKGQTAVVEELIAQCMPPIIPAIASIKNKKVPSGSTLGSIYPSLMVGLPNHIGLAIPVSGNKVIFGAETPWVNYVNEKEGIIIGRNPYDGKKLQFADIGFSPVLGKLRCMQYTLTGYTPVADAAPVGRFFKGLLVVVPDAQWPEAYASCELMVSAKDEKMNQTWKTEQAKNSAQNSEKATEITLCGMLAIKQEYPRARLIGVPKNVAQVSAGDYDGDEYNVLSTKKLPHFKEMVIKGASDDIPNPKIPKTFTPRTNISNFVKILELRKPLVERWISIQNIIYSLSLSERAKFAAEIAVDHKLEIILGEEWYKNLGMNTNAPTAMQIMIAEIQIGLKCAQDAPKTKVPFTVLDERSKSYLRLFEKLEIPVTLSYGKGFRSRFFAATENFESFVTQLSEPLTAAKGHNIVHKTQRGLVRLLTQQKADNGRIISDDEVETCTTSVTEMTVEALQPPLELAQSTESLPSFSPFASDAPTSMDLEKEAEALQPTHELAQSAELLPSFSLFASDAPTSMDLEKENELQHQTEHRSELELYPSISEPYDDDIDFEDFWERELQKLNPSS